MPILVITTFVFSLVFLVGFFSINSISFGSEEYQFVQNWPRNNDMHQISEIHDVLATKDFVFVPDYENHNMKKFTKDGDFILEWGSRGDKNGEFEGPSGIAIDSSDNVYVIDDTGRIQKFTDNGTFITSWGSDGSDDGQFSKAEGIDVDPEGNVYVADTANKRIQVFSPSSAAIAVNE